MAVTYWESETALQASEDAVAPERERERAAQTAAAASGPTLRRYEVFSSG